MQATTGDVDTARANAVTTSNQYTDARELAIKQAGPFLRNKGANFPFVQRARLDTTSPANSSFDNAILDAVVYGYQQGSGKIYKLRSFVNNDPVLTSVGADPYGIRIEEFDEDTYPTTGVNSGVDVIARTEPQTPWVRGGIQEFFYSSTLKPGLQFRFVIDTDALPAEGTRIDASSQVAAGFSWIIDPAVYVPSELPAANAHSDAGDTAIRVGGPYLRNSGAVYPMNSRHQRDGAVSADNPQMKDILLDASVRGQVEPGLYYRIAYMSVLSVDGDALSLGWILEEAPVANYGTASTVVRIQTFTTASAVISATGGVQTVDIVPTLRPNLTFRITLDANKITPTTGIKFQAVSSAHNGYSWIVDQSRYFKSYIAPTPIPVTILGGGVYFEYNHATKLLSYAYESGASMYKVGFGVNGYNGLPNLISIHKATLGDLATATWTLLSSVSTDYLPPMVFSAVNNGDGASSIYTGGNHGADGNMGGGQTARNTLFSVFADGKLLTADASGYADAVQAIVINELFAYNTITVGRYALEQAFGINMSGAGMEVHTQVKALEDIVVNTDNGPQHYFGGFVDTMLYVAGSNTARATLDPATTSGTKADYPDVWCLLTKSANGTMASWMDRSYEAGDGRYVAPTAAYIRGGGAGRAKFYHAAVAASPAALAAGETYKWRGGYHFFSDTATATVDTSMCIKFQRSKQVFAINPDGSYIAV